MRYPVIATDYDDTLASDGHVDDATLNALQTYKEAGGRLLLVTGRELTDLQQIFPQLSLFDGVVVENGAVYYCPTTQLFQRLGNPPSAAFVSALEAQQVTPLNLCQVMLATVQPHEDIVQQTIQDMSLDVQVILNKEAVMVLPKGVNKATGLQTALAEIGMSPYDVAGIGDAENDHDLLQLCDFAVAVENAVPVLKAIAHRVTTQPRGAGVQELVSWLLNEED